MKRLCKWLYCPKIITVFAPVKCNSTWMCCNCLRFVLWAVLFEIVVLTCHVYSVQNLYLILIIIMPCWLVSTIRLRNDFNYYQKSSFHLHPPSNGSPIKSSIFSTASRFEMNLWFSNWCVTTNNTDGKWPCLIGIAVVYDFMARKIFDIITEEMAILSHDLGIDMVIFPIIPEE